MPLLDMDDEFQINQSATVRGQLLTNTGAAAGNTRVKDAGAARDWGAGELTVPYLYVTPVAALNMGTSLKVDIVASTTIALTGSAVVLSTATFLVAALTAGSMHAMNPLLSGVSRRYLGVIFTISGADASTGAVVCGLVDKNARLQSYGDLANSQ